MVYGTREGAAGGGQDQGVDSCIRDATMPWISWTVSGARSSSASKASEEDGSWRWIEHGGGDGQHQRPFLGMLGQRATASKTEAAGVVVRCTLESGECHFAYNCAQLIARCAAGRRLGLCEAD